jgi:hypothetical protein
MRIDEVLRRKQLGIKFKTKCFILFCYKSITNGCEMSGERDRRHEDMTITDTDRGNSVMFSIFNFVDQSRRLTKICAPRFSGKFSTFSLRLS